MFDDARVHDRVRSSLMEAPVPPVDLVAIRRRMDVRRNVPPARFRGARVAAAATAAVIVALMFMTARAPALVQDLRERYVAALHAAGFGPRISEPVPAAIRRVAAPARVPLAEAQRRANFTVVPPAGLPRDVVSRTVFTSPLAVWSKQRNAWSTDGVQVTFAYVRGDGRAFDIIAHRYSARGAPAARYIYDADAVPRDGKPNRRNRQEQFVWRNGDQTLQVVASAAIAADEIDRIRAAMHGVPLPRYDGPARRRAGDRVERFVIP
jgi:hypothetical protein